MWKIIYKTDEQLQNIKDSWKYLTELLYLMYEKAQPGISGIELEQMAQKFIDERNLKWAFKWYMWFPANLWFSVNECVVHWIPNDYILKEWDLLKIDAWITYKGAISDAAFSKIVWWNKYNQSWYQLIKTTKKALDAGVATLELWKSFYNLGKTIYNTMKSGWFEVIRDLCGHWVGVKVHEAPYIYNFPHKDLKHLILKKNMAFAIEPITSEKSTHFIEKEPGGWDLLCEKWDLWAQWEYTVIVWKNGPEVVAWIQENLFDK